MTPEELIDSAKALMAPKRADYSSGDIWQNFWRCEKIVAWFKKDRDKVYATLVSVKIARLAVLLSSDNKPNNESIEDSFKDLINYVALWGSDRCQKQD